jgi:hypothetical protein
MFPLAPLHIGRASLFGSKQKKSTLLLPARPPTTMVRAFT